MINICFVCSWGENSNTLLDRYKTFTPSNRGVYKNIRGVVNINEADYIIVVEGFPKNNTIDINKLKEKFICFPRESIAFSKYKSWESLKIKHGYTYNNMYHVVTNPQFLNKSYDFFKTLKYTEVNKTNNISSVVSSLHQKRKQFFIKLTRKYPTMFDIYGYGWKNELGVSYKGVLSNYHTKTFSTISKTKYDGLVNYNYSICVENSREINYFTEKFTDAILCWTIPIYCGCPNIGDYFPEHSYYTIDIDSESALEDIIKISQRPVTHLNIVALEKARSLILDKYNIWSTIYNLLTN